MPKFVKQEIPEGINNPKSNLLIEIFVLLVGVIGIIAIIYYSIGFFAPKIVNFVSLEQEVRWSRSVSRKFNDISSNKDLPKNTEKKVNELLKSLWNFFDENRKIEISITVLDEEQLNAFTTVGGNFLLTSGLLKKVESENELSFVLCHELGHFKHRDVVKSMGRGIIVQTINGLLGFGGSVVEFGLHANEMSHSREQETAADRFAIECMNQKYGHVANYSMFFSRLLEADEKSKTGEEEVSEVIKTGEKVLSFFSTHPMTKDRIIQLEEYIINGGYKTDGKLTSMDGYL